MTETTAPAARAVAPILTRSDHTGPRSQRVMSHRWDTGATVEHNGRTSRVCVDVTTSHDRERRQYVTTLRVVDVAEDNGVQVTYWAAFTRDDDGRPSGAIVDRTPTARYSARDLQWMHAAAVLDLRGRPVADTSTAGADIMSRVPRES